jgi:hypothetical protein
MRGTLAGINSHEGYPKAERGWKQMRRIAVLLLAGALLTCGAMTAAAIASGGGVTANKTTICHRANSHKYVALTVSNKALPTHLAHHSDLIGPPVPQNNMKAARAYCAALPILTPKQGGRKLTATFSNTLTGVTADLNVRLRPGQGQLCFNLNVTGSTVNSATIMVAPTTINLPPLPVAPATSSSGCVNVSRAVVKAILNNPSGAAVTVTTAAGTLNGSLTK